MLREHGDVKIRWCAGRQSKNVSLCHLPPSLANDLSLFCSQFDKRDCIHQLKEVLNKLFQFPLEIRKVPKWWKISNIVPIPKKPGASELNNLRPIVLTSILCKCIQRVLSRHITSSVSRCLNHQQFAYKSQRGTVDATVTLFNTLAKHLRVSALYARVLFIDV